MTFISAQNVSVHGSSVTDTFCAEMKTAFGDINDFQRKGGLRAMGEALDRGMVLVMSLWDDSLANMLWLDSSYPPTADPSSPGVGRGRVDGVDDEFGDDRRLSEALLI